MKQPIVAFAREHPELRVIPGRFMAIEQAIAVPRHGPLGADVLDEFLAHAAATGLIDA